MRYVPRENGARAYAAALAACVHLLFVGLLVFGLSWQIHSAAPVTVELWTAAPPPPPAPQPAPVIKPPPPVPPAAPPPKAQEPVEKPDIAVEKAKQEKADRERKMREDQARVEREKKQREEQQRQERQRMEQEANRELADAERQRQQQQLAEDSQQLESEIAKSQAAAADAAAADAWAARIRAKIRSNIVVPDGIVGNPEAVFDVVQLPTGEVISVKLRKSSGFQAYDDAVERAIRKASPLPKPQSGNLFQRELKLTFRPREP
jgi:colicin import membrane protein